MYIISLYISHTPETLSDFQHYQVKKVSVNVIHITEETAYNPHVRSFSFCGKTHLAQPSQLYWSYAPIILHVSQSILELWMSLSQ